MTAEQLVRAFNSELHQRDSARVADSDDVVYFLNKAQNQFVLNRFAGKRTTAEGFEQSQDLRDDLRIFFEKDCRTKTVYGLEDAGIYDVEVDTVFLPSDYLHLVSSRAVVLFSKLVTSKGERENLSWKLGTGKFDGENFDKRIPESGEVYDRKVVPARLTQSQSVYEELNDPFHTTAHKGPVCDLNKDRLNVYTDGKFIVDAVIMNYIRQPIEISLKDEQGNSTTSELPETLHQELVDLAIRLFLQYNTQSSNEQS